MGSHRVTELNLVLSLFISFFLSSCLNTQSTIGSQAQNENSTASGNQLGGEDSILDAEEGIGGNSFLPPLAPDEIETVSLSLTPGETVGRFELDAPFLGGGSTLPDSFVIHGTLPIPKLVVPSSDGKEQFALIDGDGTIVPAQTEIVSHYPNMSFGADVVELIARVKKPTSIPADNKIGYDIVISPHAKMAFNQTVSKPQNLLLQTPQLNTNIQDLLTNNADQIKVVAADYFGNIYESNLLDVSAPNWTAKKLGRHAIQVRTYGVMKPTQIANSAKLLGHLFGVHGYFTAFSQENSMLLDLRINNGPTNDDGTTTPLGAAYFMWLSIELPNGWKLMHLAKNPLMRNGKLIDALQNGDTFCKNSTTCLNHTAGNAHFFPTQGQIERRMLITQSNNTSLMDQKAKILLERRGQAFARYGKNKNGDEMLSWWHSGTSRYLAQSIPVPMFANMSSPLLNSLISDFESSGKKLLAALQAGGSYAAGYGTLNDGALGDGENVVVPQLGGFLPLGVAYGGATSGNNINFSTGHVTLRGASYYGFLRLLLAHQMVTDRQPNALYNSDGTPFRRKDYEIPGQVTPTYFPYNWNMGPKGTDPFGYSVATDSHRADIANDGNIPSYENGVSGINGLASFQPHDQQHFKRAIKNAQALAWIANDSMVIDDLELYANIQHTQEREIPKSAAALTTQSSDIGLLNRAKEVFGISNSVNLTPYWDDWREIPPASYPKGKRSGFIVGRDFAWTLDTMTTYYALAPKSWRDEMYPWFEKSLAVYRGGQNVCNGLWSKVFTNKLSGNLHFKPKEHFALLGLDPDDPASFDAVDYYAVNIWQMQYTQVAWRGVEKTVFRLVDKVLHSHVREMLAFSAFAMVSYPIWGRKPICTSSKCPTNSYDHESWAFDFQGGDMSPVRTVSVEFHNPLPPPTSPYYKKPFWIWWQGKPTNDKDWVSDRTFAEICAPYPPTNGGFNQPDEISKMGLAESSEYFTGYDFPTFVWGLETTGLKYFMERAAEHRNGPGTDYPFPAYITYDYKADSIQQNMQDFLNSMNSSKYDTRFKAPAIGISEDILNSLP